MTQNSGNMFTINEININKLINEKNLLTINVTDRNHYDENLINILNMEQKHWYLINMYMYMNMNDIDYPIKLESIYKTIGFANKGNAKRTIENNFILNTDYKIINENEKMYIYLNIKTFKKLCLMTKSKFADQIRDYYIKIEDHYNSINNV